MGDTHRELERQKYWKEFDEQWFFKIMINDFRLKLWIPEKFGLNLKDKLLGRKILRGPSGNLWTVEIKREKDKYFFSDGWNAFVDDHCLDLAYCLFFRMNKSVSSFDVSIYDASACAKEDAFFVKKKESSHEEEIPCDHVNDGSNGSPSSKEKLKEVLVAYEYRTTDENFASEKDSLEFSEDHDRKNQLNQKQRRVNRKEKSVCGNGSSLGKKSSTTESANIFIKIRERKSIKVQQVASTHKSSLPCVLLTMLPTCINYGHLRLPMKWVEENMRNQSEIIYLRIPSSEKIWEAELIWRNGVRIQKGWARFAMDNRLDEHDICVIELAEGGKHDLRSLVLDVHIYRS